MTSVSDPTPSRVVESAVDVQPDHITQMLRRHGLIDRERVIQIVAEPIGTGQMADCARLRLTYGGPSDGPATLIAKFASSDDRSRATGKALRAYEVEVGFYRELAATLGVRTPTCYDATIDLESGSFTLVLEDLAPAVTGDQLEGCGPDLADVVLTEAVALHAPRWGDRSLESIDWLARMTPHRATQTARLIAGLYPMFLERFGSSLDDDITTCLDAAIAGAEQWWQPLTRDRTIQHCDFRLDNLLIGHDDDSGTDRVWVVDWQTVTLGFAMGDVSYFIGGNLLPEVRRLHETDLVREYHRQLVAAGVTGYSWDQCWLDYRRGSWSGVFMTLGASMLVEQTERGDRMFLTNINRHARHALDLEATPLLTEDDHV